MQAKVPLDAVHAKGRTVGVIVPASARQVREVVISDVPRRPTRGTSGRAYVDDRVAIVVADVGLRVVVGAVVIAIPECVVDVYAAAVADVRR